MLFSSITFIFLFLPITLAAYFLLPRTWRNPVLLVASLFFYAWGEPVYVILMVFSILLNYVGGLDIGAKLREGKRSALRSLIILLVVNFALLGTYKYYGFFAEVLNAILPVSVPVRQLSLPIGISFYTFQAVSYLIDVYREKVQPQRSLLNFGLYISMFPQLIAGPIVRYRDIEAQLKDRKIYINDIGHGVHLFVIGLAKKAILANGIGNLHNTISSWISAGETGIAPAWLGAVAYMLQIYFDFSGYSDMAIGLARMFGFRFRKNFDNPYISRSITEFWRRWHISLSSWFKEYVYIPLGGSRVTVPRHIFNLLVVWLLTGFWHGASWNFIFWGVYYGVVLILEKYLWGARLAQAPALLQHIYSLAIVLIGWVFFFSDGMGNAVHYLSLMFGAGASLALKKALYLVASNWLLLLIGILCATDIPRRLLAGIGYIGKRKYLMIALTAVVFVLSISCLITDTFNPFLYFRF